MDIEIKDAVQVHLNMPFLWHMHKQVPPARLQASQNLHSGTQQSFCTALLLQLLAGTMIALPLGHRFSCQQQLQYISK